MKERRTSWIVALAAWSATGVLSYAQQPADVKPITDRLTAAIYGGPGMSTLEELADGVGGRVTGGPAYVRATEWAAAKFRSYGIENVRLEPFTIEAGWQRGTARGTMVSPVARPLTVASVGWTPSTPAGGVEGEVAMIEDVSVNAFRLRDDLGGKIAYLDTGKIIAEDMAKGLAKLDEAWPELQRAGVLAVLAPDHEKNNVLNAHDSSWGARLLPLPVVGIGMEDGQLIERELRHGPVRVHLTVENRTAGETTVNNVVAEIRGRERPEEWILVGAHLDSWDFGTGVQDDGAGAVSVLEVARAMMALGKPPRRSVRFVLWGGEEQGMLGSYAYTQAHKKELAKCVAVLNDDNGAGHPKGWKVEGRSDLKQAMQPWSDGLLKELSGGELSMATTYDTDHGPFVLQGIPTLDLWVDMTKYFDIHHKASDTFDKVDALDFKAGAAIVAATAWAMAESERPIAPHIDHVAVREILRNARLEALVEEAGMWKP